MAAGKGARISRHIGERPKCTLDIGGGSLIAHTVRMLLGKGVEVSVVLGYKKEAVIDALAGLSVSYFSNPFYDVTNSIASLWFARSAIGGDDLIIGNADVYWDEDVFDILSDDHNDPVMLADSSRGEEGDYLFKFEDGRLLKYGKDLRGDDVSGEYVGIARIKLKFQNIFLSRLQALIDDQQHSMWWEDVLYSLIGDERVIYVRDIRGLFWSEIDFIEDYDRIREYRS
jgi:L-glutamine-phosphate cytidylyltransferase